MSEPDLKEKGTTMKAESSEQVEWKRDVEKVLLQSTNCGVFTAKVLERLSKDTIETFNRITAQLSVVIANLEVLTSWIQADQERIERLEQFVGIPKEEDGPPRPVLKVLPGGKKDDYQE